MTTRSMFSAEDIHYFQSTMYNMYLCKLWTEFISKFVPNKTLPRINIRFDWSNNIGSSPGEIISEFLQHCIGAKTTHVNPDDEDYAKIFAKFPLGTVGERYEFMKIDFPEQFKFEDNFEELDEDDDPFFMELYFWGQAYVKVWNSTIVFGYSTDYSGDANYVTVLNYIISYLERYDLK